MFPFSLSRPRGLAGSRGRTTTRALTATAALGALANAVAAQSLNDAAFSFSGTHRSRYEALDPQFRPGLSASDRVLAMKTSLSLQAHLPRLTLVGEIMDSRALLNDEGSLRNTAIVNALEPIQAYVALPIPAGRANATSTLRLGLMTLDLGKRRLLARNRFRNTVTSFVGADWEWHDARARAARVFFLQPRHALPTDADALLDNEPQLDRTLGDSALWGLYFAPMRGPAGNVLETYLLSLRLSPKDPAAAIDLVSAGLRAYRASAPREWSYEVEAVMQSGTRGATVAGIARRGLDTRAHFLHLELGYTLAGPWSPTLLAQYDVATGDRDPFDTRSERFDTLFGARRFDFGPTGIFGPFVRSNLETPGARIMVQPRADLRAMAAYRVYYLESARDTWIGTGLADPTGRSGDCLGRELEARFTWAAIQDRLSFEAGIAKLELGAFPAAIQGAAPRGDPTYFYAAVTTRF